MNQQFIETKKKSCRINYQRVNFFQLNNLRLTFVNLHQKNNTLMDQKKRYEYIEEY